MSNYFKGFPQIQYLFGDENYAVSFQKLSKYVDLLDNIKDSISTYIEYEIDDFERPDSLSARMYGKSEYEWTFFLMNPRLRETGWPLAKQELYEYAQTELYKNYSCKLDISTGDSASEWMALYPPGQAVWVGGTHQGVVVRKNLEVGEIIVSSPNDSDLTTYTTLQYRGDSAVDGTNLVALSNTVYEYEGIHHYKNDSGDWVDFYFGGSGETPVTNLEHLETENDLSKRIRVINANQIESIVGEFKRLMKI